MMAKRVEPTPEDFRRAEESIKVTDARQILLEHLARSEAYKRLEQERHERRQARLRKLTFGFLGR